MPRRSTRAVAPVQDDIEVDEQEHVASQHDSVQDADQPIDSAEDEAPEQKPLARSKKSKSVKTKSEKRKKSRARRDASDDENDPDGGGPSPPFNRDEFLAAPRPIPENGQRPISGLIADQKEVLHQVEHVGFEFVEETAIAVEEISGNTEEGQEAANQLDAVMRQLIDVQHDLKAHIGSLETLKQTLHRGEIVDKLEDAYISQVNDATEIYASRTTRQKYAKDERYFKFRDRLWEINHDDAMPPMGDLIPQEEGDSDAESDIEIGGMTQDYKCPLTLTLLTDPLTSKLCNHSFSADAIREYITGARGRRECPASGCNKVLTIADLTPNEELAKRATDAARRAKRREDDSDDDSGGDVVD